MKSTQKKNIPRPGITIRPSLAFSVILFSIGLDCKGVRPKPVYPSQHNSLLSLLNLNCLKHGRHLIVSICGPKRNLGLSVEVPRACRQEQKYSFCVCKFLSVHILSNQSEKIARWNLIYCSHMFMSFYCWNFEVQEQSMACRSSLLWHSAGCKAGRSNRLVLTGSTSVQTFGRRSPWLSFFSFPEICARVCVSHSQQSGFLTYPRYLLCGDSVIPL